MAAALLLDVTELIIYLVDHQQRVLVPLPGPHVPMRETIDVDGTLAGRAFTTVTSCEAASNDVDTVWIPLVNGSERLGVLEVTAVGDLSEEVRVGCDALAALLAEMVLSRTRYGDAIEVVRRRQNMRLPAELVRAQLPPSTFSTDRLIIERDPGTVL